MPKPAPQDYPYIRAWGWMMGSDRYYIEQEIETARADKAPEDAIYWRFENETERTGAHVWHRFADVTNPSTTHAIERYMSERYPNKETHHE